MSQITAIEPQKRKKGRFNIFVDGEFAFGLDEFVLLSQKLKVGQKISSQKIEKLIEENELGKLMDKAMRFLSYRPRSEKEVKDHLVKKEAGKKAIQAILKKLKKLKLVNDKEFAKWWIENRIKFRPRSSRILFYELTQKGIKREIIERVLEEESIYKDHEFDLVLKLAQKRQKFYKNLPKREFRQKMGNYLLRRGFSWETIKKVIDTILTKV